MTAWAASARRHRRQMTDRAFFPFLGNNFDSLLGAIPLTCLWYILGISGRNLMNASPDQPYPLLNGFQVSDTRSFQGLSCRHPRRMPRGAHRRDSDFSPSFHGRKMPPATTRKFSIRKLAHPGAGAAQVAPCPGVHSIQASLSKP